MSLMRDRPFASVSIDEIATAAGIGRRTFFRYFPTKEDIFLDRRRFDRAAAIAAVRQRQPGEDDVSLLLRVLVEVQARGFSVFSEAQQPDLHRLTHGEPELAARSWLLLEDVRDALVSGLVGANPDPAVLLRARVLVSGVIMVVDTGITTWIEGGMRRELRAVLEEGAAHLRRGFASPT